MKLGIRGRLFALSVAIIAIAVAVLSAYVSAELRSAIEEQLTQDLDVRTALIAQQVDAEPPAQDWQAVAEELGRRALSRATLIAADGTVLGDSEVARDRVGQLENHGARPEFLDAMRTGHGQAKRRSVSIDHDLIYVAVRLRDGPSPVAVVRLAQSLTPVDTAVARAHHVMFVGALLGMAVAGLLSSGASHLFSQSLRDLRTSAVAMLDDLSVRTHMRGDDEIGALAEALDRLADNLRGTVQNLASERDRLAGILETMAEGVLLTGSDGRVVLANAALRMMVGSTGKVVGREPIEAIRNDELAELISTVAATQTPETGEVELVGIVPRRVLVRAAPLTLRGSHGVVAVLSDVTELRRLESLRRDFVANVSHELRTPIAAIRAAAETLEGGALDDPAVARDFMGMISRHSERLHTLVEDLLQLSRIEAHKLDLHPSAIGVSELYDHLIALYALSAERWGVKLRKGATPERLALLSDRRALEQILSNLIDNAIKYAGRGAFVTLEAQAGEAGIVLSVRDSGPGISPRHLPRLFERFYRVDRGRSRDVGGTGLGLSIVKHLTEALGGSVDVESAPGAGATFHVRFPPQSNASSPGASPSARSDHAGLSHQP